MEWVTRSFCKKKKKKKKKYEIFNVLKIFFWHIFHFVYFLIGISFRCTIFLHFHFNIINLSFFFLLWTNDQQDGYIKLSTKKFQCDQTFFFIHQKMKFFFSFAFSFLFILIFHFFFLVSNLPLTYPNIYLYFDTVTHWDWRMSYNKLVFVFSFICSSFFADF